MPTKRKPNSPPNTSLHRYFSSEALFQEALAKLLNRMPDISGVQILQGSHELGKDLIFYIRGAFGERFLCACVVKNSKISGQVGNASGARTVLFQAQQAFDSVHTDAFGKELRVERVYVVTPYNLSPATILSIKGSLQERAGQVVFIGGSILFDLFKEYWPGYFADESEFIQAYLETTKANFEAESPLHGLGAQYNLGDTDSYSRAIYVHQVIHREVYAYELGPLLSDKLATAGSLNRKMRGDAVERLTSNAKKLRGAIQFLAEWELCPPKQKEQFFFLAASFISSLSEGWKKGSRESNGDPHNQLNEQRLLHDFANIVDNLSALEECKQEALINIRAEVAAVKKTVRDAQLQGIQALSDPAYLQACSLDDCARSAPEGIFVRKIALRIDFPTSILETWTGPLLVVGAPGFGKTSFCKWHALRDVEKSSTWPRRKLKAVPGTR